MISLNVQKVTISYISHLSFVSYLLPNLVTLEIEY